MLSEVLATSPQLGQIWVRDPDGHVLKFIVPRESSREERLAGLFSRHAGQEASTLTPALEARILDWTLKREPPDGSTQWSTRKLGAQLKISHMMVARVWTKHGLKPHRLDRYMGSNDPDFEKKAADIIGLYLNPPAHAAVFCVDEKTAIQALDRKDPVLPLSPGRAERHGFSTSVTARCLSTPPSTRGPGRCWGRPPHDTRPRRRHRQREQRDRRLHPGHVRAQVRGDRADRHVHVGGRVAGDELSQRQRQDHRPACGGRLGHARIGHTDPACPPGTLPSSSRTR